MRVHRRWTIALLLPALAVAAHALAAGDPVATGPRKPLDLRAPPIERVIPPAQLEAMFRAAEQREAAASAAGEDTLDDVTVEGPRTREPVPPGLRALWWGAKNPGQIWRLFAPIT